MSPLTIVAVAACVIASAATAVAAADGVPIRVMSFNIRNDNGVDGEHGWPNRRDLVAQILRLHRPDAVGLQEVFPNQRDDLLAALPGYAAIGVGRDDGIDGGEMCVILYRRDRFDVVDSGTFWLSPTHEQVGSRGWDAALPRIATWARFRDRDSGDAFIHLNTHFDHVGETARVESAKLIVDRLGNLAADLPFVVTGDLNALPHAPEVAALLEATVDARLAAIEPPIGPETTWSSFAVATQLDPGVRIDYVLVNPASIVTRQAHLTPHWHGRHASDHFPVLADVVLLR